MRPNPLIGNHPRVGVEIEISRWEGQTLSSAMNDYYKNGMNYHPPSTSHAWNDVRNNVAKQLVANGLMADGNKAMGMVEYYEKFHTWNCSCTTCKQWENSNTDPYPVQFALKYDGTLPLYGGEFITSPFTLDHLHWESFYKGWDIITKEAIADRLVWNKQGSAASPSIHVHASCVNDDFPSRTGLRLMADFIEVFAPEIFVLSGATETVSPRELKYRKINHMSLNDQDHHNYMNWQAMRKLNPKGAPITVGGVYQWSGPHIELRTWEPVYDDPQYIEGAVHVTAALAQVLSSGTLMSKLLALVSLKTPFRRDIVNMAAYNNAICFEDVVDLVDPTLYQALKHVLTTVTYAAHDEVSQTAISYMFDKAQEVWL